MYDSMGMWNERLDVSGESNFFSFFCGLYKLGLRFYYSITTATLI